ncbi:hypothetical protein ACYATL_07375 [Actinotignum timonense]|nr:hypothetical protein [Actinotignum schaalii]MDK7272190.1 hypothetical protein [Actinotignum schaalii]
MNSHISTVRYSRALREGLRRPRPLHRATDLPERTRSPRRTRRSYR